MIFILILFKLFFNTNNIYHSNVTAIIFEDMSLKRHKIVIFLPTEYSKRVYQGVRVKHTVKDLLAEKRLRQTTAPRFSVSHCSCT